MNTIAQSSSASDAPDVRLTLLAEPSSVVLAREMVRYALTRWNYDREVIYDSMVVMSELVTNAVAAARGRHIRIRCAVENGSPLLECWDPSPAGPPKHRSPAGASPSSRPTPGTPAPVPPPPAKARSSGLSCPLVPQIRPRSAARPGRTRDRPVEKPVRPVRAAPPPAVGRVRSGTSMSPRPPSSCKSARPRRSPKKIPMPLRSSHR